VYYWILTWKRPEEFVSEYFRLFCYSVPKRRRTPTAYRTIILPVLWFKCETWSVTPREINRLKVFENLMLRRIFGPQGGGGGSNGAGECRIMKCSIIFSLYHILGWSYREDKIIRACSMHERDRKLWWQVPREETRSLLVRAGAGRTDREEIGW
jgi:hypothetical protein